MGGVKNISDIRDAIESEFYGTAGYHRIQGGVLLTDGALYVAEACGAFWLMDIIASYLPKVNDSFAVAQLKLTEGSSARFTLTDDLPPGKVYATQEIEYTDFPLPEGMCLWCEYSDGVWVILLPSEH